MHIASRPGNELYDMGFRVAYSAHCRWPTTRGHVCIYDYRHSGRRWEIHSDAHYCDLRPGSARVIG